MGGIRRQAQRWGLRAIGVALLLGMVAPEARAAISHVKDLGVMGNNAMGGATSLSLPLTVGAAVGNRVIASFAMDPSAGAVTCSDTKGNTYTVDNDVTNGSATTGVRAVVCSSQLGTALVAGDQITVTHPSAPARTMSVSEFTGIAAVDQTASATGNSTTLSSGTTPTTTDPNELLIGAFGVETKKDEPFTPDAPWAALPRESSDNVGGPTGQVSINPAFQIVSATGTFSSTGSIAPARLWAGLIVTYRSTCGNGVVNPGETCDDGNNTNGDCCSSVCTFEAAGTVCRASAGICDVQETCSGASGTCPADGFQSASTTCRGSAGICDAAESCTGSAAACPADGKSTSECRAAAGTCDVAESCDGVGDNCPADAVQAGGTECRGAAGACDLAESCNGTSAACPADAKSTAECRGAAGVCDTAESCDGVTDNCPADAVQTAGTTCRAATDVCDAAESCDGAGTACPADGFVAGGTECRGAAGVCDVAESCTGSGATCPADVKSTTECRAAAGTCDVAESCDGTGNDCPADALQIAGTECRASAGACDVAETCDGSAAACPTDGKSTAECRAAAGVCDVAETCDGAADTCPADAVQPGGTTCRPSAGVCDVAETCDGAATACPNDALRPATDECRAAAGTCDLAELCSGTGADCPIDALRPATDVCRASADVCDAAENCTGSTAACPADAFSGPAVTCRDAAGACDVAEGCSGTSAACPPDQLQLASFICRPSTGPCDPEETCSEGGASCPADVGEPDSDTDGVCDSGDSCPTQADADQADGDADGIGDACDPCNNIVPVFASRSKIRIAGLDTPPGDDRLLFKGTMTMPSIPTIDPATNGVRILLDDAGSNALDVIVPGGAGWKTSKSGHSWRYANASGPGGIVKIRLRHLTRKPGTLKFRVIGRAESLAIPRSRIPMKGTLVVDAPIALTGQCGETPYDGSRCKFSRSGRSLRCR